MRARLRRPGAILRGIALFLALACGMPSALPVFYGPMRLLVRHKFLSDTCARAVRVPALVVASRDDEVIPFASSEKLNNRLGGGSTFVPLDGVDHNSILYDRTALESIRVYLETIWVKSPVNR